MAEFTQKNVCNFQTLGQYHYGGLGVGSVAPYHSAIPKYTNIVPQFAGFSYEKPNYNSLVHGACNWHVGVNQAYGSGNCVKYIDRSCPGPEGRSAPKQPQQMGHTGHTGPMKKERFQYAPYDDANDYDDDNDNQYFSEGYKPSLKPNKPTKITIKPAAKK
jgi:hypothetical protein